MATDRVIALPHPLLQIQNVSLEYHTRHRTKYVTQSAKIKIFTIDDAFGGWRKADKEHFADGAASTKLAYCVFVRTATRVMPARSISAMTLATLP